MANNSRPFIIDADSHVEEGENIWQHLDQAYAMRRPKIIERPIGPGEPALDKVWLIDGHTFPNFHGRAPRLWGRRSRRPSPSRSPFSIASQSLTPPQARVADLDKAGIDVQVLFPTIFLIPITPDVEYEAALMRLLQHMDRRDLRPVPRAPEMGGRDARAQPHGSGRGNAADQGAGRGSPRRFMAPAAIRCCTMRSSTRSGPRPRL